jgi:hypothetical protein
MPYRDDDRGFGRDRFAAPDRWRDQRREGRPSGRGEDRSFERGRYNSDQARYGEAWNTADQDRSDYGSGYDRYSGDYGHGHGQEYGMEGGHPRRDTGRYGDQARERWTPAGGVPYGDIELEGPNRGFEEFGPPADYAFHPVAGHEFDPHYRQWRDEQMRAHDRDYQDWRRAQHLKYDDDYRRFREERQEHFGRTFQDWRAQRSMVGGVPDTGVAPGVTGDSGGVGRGYAGADMQRPSGMLDPSLNMTSDPVLSQTGSHPMAHPASPPPASARSPTPEFGKEPPAVQAAADGSTKGHKDEGRH